MRHRFADLLPIMVFFAASIIIMGPLLTPGFLFTLDPMITGSNPNNKAPFYPSQLPVSLLIEFLGQAIPTWIIQKVFIVIFLTIAGYGAFRLQISSSLTAKYYSGLVYLLSPFVFTRIVSGQANIFFAYATMPFVVQAGIDLLKEPVKRRAVLLGVLSGIVAIFSPQMFVITVALLILVLLVYVAVIRPVLIPLFKLFAFSLATALILNSYWIITILIDTTVNPISTVRPYDIAYFAPSTAGSGFNVLAVLASMNGFWISQYRYIWVILPFWYLFFIVIYLLATLGAITHYKEKKIRVYSLAFIAAAFGAIIFATLPSFSLTRDVLEVTMERLPVLATLRETQKSIAVLALTYSFLGGMGVSSIMKFLSGRSLKHIIALLLISIPIIYGANLFWGFNGSINNRFYPDDWYTVHDYISTKQDDGSVLFLPWHQYFYVSWIGYNTFNVGATFFPHNVIYASNIDAGTPRDRIRSSDHEVLYITDLLDNQHISNLGSYLAAVNVKYIVLALESEYGTYDFLYNQSDLRIVTKTEKLVLFENTAWKGSVYMVNSKARFTNWDAMIKNGNKPLLESLNTDNDRNVGNNTDLQSLNYSVTPLGDYVISYNTSVPTTMIIAEEYNAYWRSNSGALHPNFNVTMAIDDIQGSGTLYVWNGLAYLKMMTIAISFLSTIALVVWGFELRPTVMARPISRVRTNVKREK